MFEDDNPLRDQLEAYALGRTPPEDLERIETHLLICERCRGEVSQTDEYSRAMKRAAASLRNGSPAEAAESGDHEAGEEASRKTKAAGAWRRQPS